MPAPKPSSISVGELSGSDATNALHATIRQFTQDSTRQTTKLIGLTWAIVALTIVMLLGLFVQIWLAWPR
jgi:hypothetical protein